MRDLGDGDLAVDVFDDFADIVGKVGRVLRLVGLDDMEIMSVGSKAPFRPTGQRGRSTRLALHCRWRGAACEHGNWIVRRLANRAGAWLCEVGIGVPSDQFNLIFR